MTASMKVYDFPSLRQVPETVTLEPAAEEINAATDLDLQRVGDEYKGWCPLHQVDGRGRPERRKDLFFKAKDSGGFYFGCSSPTCHGSDTDYWSALRAALLTEGVPERFLAPSGQGGSGNTPTTPSRPRRHTFPDFDGVPEREGTYVGAQTIAGWEANLREESDLAKAAREYAERRGWSAEVMEACRVGYNPQKIELVVPLLAPDDPDTGEARAFNVVYLKVPPVRDLKRRFRQEPEFGSPARLHGIYDLPADTAEPIVVCEGFWDALLVRSLGLAAVTPTMGAGNLPRLKDVECLRDRNVVLCLDRDEAGRRGTEKWLSAFGVWGGAASVRVLALPGLSGGESDKDVTDWWRAVRARGEGDHAGQQLRALVQEAPVERLAVATTAGRERFRVLGPEEWSRPAPPMTWDVRGIWPQGSYGPLGGEKKSLKTYCAMGIGLALASGLPAFGHHEFAVPTARPVLYFSGEGGHRLAASRLRRIAAAYGIVDVGDLPFHLVCDAAPLNSDLFLGTLNRLLDDHQPGLVVLDPLYAFHPPGIEAGNLYDRGRLLHELSAVTTAFGTSLMVPDHFRKTGGKDLDLDSIAQAGMAAWADSWVLQGHRVPPTVHLGDFRLQVQFGSREGYGRTWDIDWALGAFDYDTGEHSGDISWKVEPHDEEVAAERAAHRIADQIVSFVAEHPDGVTKTDTFEAKDAEGQAYVRGRKESKDKAWDECVASGSLIDAEDGRAARRGRKVVCAPAKRPLRRSRSAAEVEEPELRGRGGGPPIDGAPTDTAPRRGGIGRTSP